MAHCLRLFAGHPRGLLRYRALVPALRLFYLTPGAELAVIPIDDDGQDALHRAYGTGEWLDTLGMQLTSSDAAFAADASRSSAIAYLQTDYAGGTGAQAAALWIGGDWALRPLSLAADVAGNRPRATWPINAALRGLGVKSVAGRDEFDCFGLGAFPSFAAIIQHALSIRV
jgi:hypothetical protein